jgi:hypothetical protein
VCISECTRHVQRFRQSRVGHGPIGGHLPPAGRSACRAAFVHRGRDGVTNAPGIGQRGHGVVDANLRRIRVMRFGECQPRFQWELGVAVFTTPGFLHVHHGSGLGRPRAASGGRTCNLDASASVFETPRKTDGLRRAATTNASARPRWRMAPPIQYLRWQRMHANSASRHRSPFTADKPLRPDHA